MEPAASNPAIVRANNTSNTSPSAPAPKLKIGSAHRAQIAAVAKQSMDALPPPPTPNTPGTNGLNKRLSKEIPAETSKGFTPLKQREEAPPNLFTLSSDRMYRLPVNQQPAAAEAKPAAIEAKKVEASSDKVVVKKVGVQQLYDDAAKLKTTCEPKKELRSRTNFNQRNGEVTLYTKKPPADLDADSNTRVQDKRKNVDFKSTDQPYASPHFNDRGVEIIAGDQKQGGFHESQLFAQEETSVEKSIGLAVIGDKKLMADQMREGSAGSGKGRSVGGYIKDMPVDYEINSFQKLTNPKLKLAGPNIYGNNLETNYQEYVKDAKSAQGKKGFLKGIVSQLKDDKGKEEAVDYKKEFVNKLMDEKAIVPTSPNTKRDFLYVVAPKPTPNSAIDKNQVLDLFNSFNTGYQSLLEASSSSKSVIIPGGWVGCGAFNNNYEVSLVAQLVSVHLAADASKLDPNRNIEFVFHNTGDSKDMMQRAKAEADAYKCYKEVMKPLIERGATKAELAQALVDHAAKNNWKNRGPTLG